MSATPPATVERETAPATVAAPASDSTHSHLLIVSPYVDAGTLPARYGAHHGPPVRFTHADTAHAGMDMRPKR
jgi:hypothetical protein